MIKKEFGMIWEHKIILATLLGIMFIPFLYSVFFLKSVWDPYGNVDKLPVAVVNDDRPVTFQDKQLDVGDQLVANMKKQDGLEWHFVSAQKAKEGMSQHKYYMVVTVPKNFSKNAATVLNDKPQKMNLKYQTNDSLNYIGQVITKEAAGQLNNKVSKTVSTAYADTMFGVVKQVGAGFGKAAKGAVKLSDGSKALSNGLTTYTAGVKTLNDGVMTMHAGVEPLSAGIVQLADGSLVLDKGLHTYTGAVSQVNQGVQTLRAGTVPLASGVSQLQNGAQTLSGGINQYTGAVGQLNGGLQQLAGNSKQLQQAAGQLSQLPQGVAATYVLGNTVSDSVGVLTGQLKEQLPKITAAQKGLNSLMTPENEKQLAALGTTIAEMNTMITNFSTQLGGLTEQLNSIGANDQDSAVKAQQVLAVIEKLPAQQQEQMAGSQEDLKQIIKNSQENGETLKNIQAIQGTVAGAKVKLSDAQKSLAALSGLTGQIKQLSAGMNSQGETLDVATMTKQLAALESAASQLKSASTQLNAGVNGQKSNGTYHYTTDPDQLRVQVSQIAGQSSLPTMLNGLTQYTNGVKTAANGASQLNQNGTQLRGGASQLNGGLTAIGAQVPTLVGGINTLANGTSQLNANGGQLVAGADTLAGGIGQLNAQVPTLVNGIDTLANGSAQLAGNSDKLNGASGQVAKGTGTLSKSLKDGAKEVNSTNLGKKNAQMFATPTRLQHSNYSKVPNYGFALAPYMLSVALYVGALVFNLVYPLRKMGGDDSTANGWFGSKVAIGGVVAVANALVELLLMMAVGLTPQNVGGFLLNGIMFSLAAMYIVMLLSIAFDNPGRFIGMILLVIQLGASGGSFPIEITTGMNGFFQAVNPFLPMTWSVYSFRESLTGGFGSGQITQSFLILLIFIVVSLVLLWVATQVLHNKVTYEPGPSSVVQESGNRDKE
ncbi:YhgE/Pip domain-containing protein [Ligilactobacillus acidipiscis]|nr:YhgE/Pip domain-containing protein [Ligilactobacillus acidipiscis]WEV58063.1 YhgE/Pip domain-containing protein [Ligilactobacillus acidipiscis]